MSLDDVTKWRRLGNLDPSWNSALGFRMRIRSQFNLYDLRGLKFRRGSSREGNEERSRFERHDIIV